MHRQAPGEAEGELGAVDAVIAAVDEGHGDVDHLEAERTLDQRLANAVLDRRNPLLRHGAAVDLLLELEAFAPAEGTDFDDDVAELAVPARLLLVAAVLADRLADGFAVADLRRVALHVDAVAALEAADDGVQMLVVDATKADFVIGIVMLDDERRVLLGEPLQRARQLDVVLAVGGLDGEGAVPRRIFDLDRRRDLARPEPLAGPDVVHLGDGDDIAGPGFADLLRLFALDLEHRSGAGMVAGVGLQVGAFRDLSAERAAEGEPAHRSVLHLEGVDRRVRDGEAAGGRFRTGRFVTQRLEQAAHAPGTGRASEQDGHAEALAGFAREVCNHAVLLGGLVHEQLLEQLVVMIGEVLQHLRACFRLALLKLLGNLDALGFLARHVMVGAFQREIDEAA